MIFTVSESQEGVLLLSFLRGTCGVSGRFLTRLKQTENGITVNGEHVTVRKRLHAGDLVEIAEKDPASQDVFPPEPLPVRILYEDDTVLLVSKPPLMPTHPSRRHYTGTLGNALSHLFAERGQAFSFRPANRLDRNTSGIVLLAKDQWTACRLCEDMKAHRIRKTYFALTDGVPALSSGRMDGWIRRKTPGIVLRELCSEDAEGAESVRTSYDVLARGTGHALIRLRPETGRTHQLRVQLAGEGCPVTGDGLYGTDSPLISRQALHAGVLEWRHPSSGEWHRTEDPIPEDMASLCRLWFGGREFPVSDF